MGGIYSGVFTATEAAGVGAFGAFIIVLLKRKITLNSFYETLLETAKVTSMLFFLLFGAILFSNFINLAGLPNDLRDFLSMLNMNIYTLLIGIFIIYLNGFQFGIRYGREGSQLSIVLSGFNEPSSLCYLNPFHYLLLSKENIHL